MNKILLAIVIFLHTATAFAELTIEIVGGREGGQPIAIIPFGIQTGTAPLPQDMAAIISANLARTGRFAPTPFGQLPERPFEIAQVNFPTWQGLGTPHLVVGRILSTIPNNYTVEFELIDTFNTSQIIGLRYVANKDTLRRVAHQISDVIYEKLTGEKGVFATRIAYVTKTRGNYVLQVADADGYNPKVMLSSSEPIFSPTWSPDGTRIAYVSLEGKRSGVYVQDVRSGGRSRIVSFQGNNSAPAWSPDGTRLAVSLSRDGNPEIYIVSLVTKNLTRLTNHPAIDTEPDWSPDGGTIVFTSDRTGAPQLYRMSASGGDAQRLTFQGGYNARPRFSPDGKLIAMIHRGGGGYNIATLDLTTGQTNVLTQSGDDESPSFAPNGSMILYGSGRNLAAVAIDGSVSQRLSVNVGGEVREPAWSPY